MNRIKTSDILDPGIQQPFTGRSLDFLQDANKEMVKGIILEMLGKAYNPAKYYLVSGLYQYGTNQYSEGSIFFNGELFHCSGKSTTTAFANVPVLTLDTNTSIGSPYDPLIFTDNVSRNVHLYRRMILSDAPTGSGTVDLFSCMRVNRVTDLIPVLKAYDGPGNEVPGGFTTGGSYNYCQYAIYGNIIHFMFVGQNFSVASNVRKLTLGLPPDLSSVNIAGTSIVGFQIAGTTTGFTGIAFTELGAISIRRTDNNTDFPVMAGNGALYLNMMAFIS